ncbi:MAG: DUF1080 domain-containing protein [Verrucomicrobiota bacterium]
MKRIVIHSGRCAALAVATLALGLGVASAKDEKYVAPTEELPSPKEEPKVVTPRPFGAPPSSSDLKAFNKAGGFWFGVDKRPADAVVIFDGKDLSKWRAANGGESKWKVENGALVSVKGAGYIHSKDKFGDCQLHIEWATPSEVSGEGQGRGNSGVFFADGKYEVQVLDSYNNKTYFHGQAAGVYKQHAPLVNACRPPGEWQTYDIIYRAPRFDGSGNLVKPGRLTVLHNSILVQDDVMILGTTSHKGAPKYTAHPVEGALALQDHGNPVRFRNIWVRPLTD